MSDQDYRALRESAGAVDLPRDFVRATGPDVVSFLQGQLSQDVAGLAPGASTWALLLQPQGKVVAFLRVLRMGDEEFVLETDAGFGDPVVERLNRFKLRVKADLDRLAWKCVAVRGPKAHDLVDGGVVADWPGLPGADLVGESPAPPEGVPSCALEAYEAVRIEAGIPVMGKELDENTIPEEAGVVPRSVSFTKGCYTGQELVARIDSRGGNVPRRLRGLIVHGSPPLGATLEADGKDAGRVTSVAWSPGLGSTVALAYVRRAVEPPADVVVTWVGGSAPARVEALPLVS
ncbi:MAG TPA: glycine cleavage T C-terminal barrel domain-containing protein [Acidimicrobiales bacterium]|nr:glycine cleavage T C-terminal barrel domain-containing protein [Acidimicrobiales bacterium]